MPERGSMGAHGITRGLVFATIQARTARAARRASPRKPACGSRWAAVLAARNATAARRPVAALPRTPSPSSDSSSSRFRSICSRMPRLLEALKSGWSCQCLMHARCMIRRVMWLTCFVPCLVTTLKSLFPDRQLALVRTDRAHTRGKPAKRRAGNWIMGGGYGRKMNTWRMCRAAPTRTSRTGAAAA